MTPARFWSEAKQYQAGRLHDFAYWATVDALPWFVRELEGVLGTKVMRLGAADVIRAGIAATPAEAQYMAQTVRFYSAQMIMLDAELKRFAASALGLCAGPPGPFALVADYELRQGIWEFLLDGMVMLERAGQHRLNLTNAFGVHRSRVDRTFEIYKAAEQAIYGRYSGLTHTDRAPFAPVAMLRTALELRMRRAFGSFVYVHLHRDDYRPLNLSELFEAIFQFESSIIAAVNLHDINRIYRWSNPYLHAGQRDYAWVAGYALQYLRPLFSGPDTLKSRGGWSIHGGLEMPIQAWESVRRRLDHRTRRQGWVVNPMNPDYAEAILF